MEINCNSWKINHLINANSQWDEDMLAQLLSIDLIASVKLIPIPQG